MSEFLPNFLIYWLASYSALAGIYLVVGKFVIWFNRTRLQDKQIQSRECPQELVHRDIRQSLKSLLNISGMLALGLSVRSAGLAIAPVELT
ncbi:MAG: hypothetical protein RLN85_05125, partial [Pseudomonadales bacterium]